MIEIFVRGEMFSAQAEGILSFAEFARSVIVPAHDLKIRELKNLK